MIHSEARTLVRLLIACMFAACSLLSVAAAMPLAITGALILVAFIFLLYAGMP